MAINPYDDTLEQFEDEQTPLQAPKPTTVNPYAVTIRELNKGQETRLRAATIDAEKQAPERAAEVLRLSERMGIPAAVVERNFEDIQKRAKVAETPYAQMLRETPALASFMEDPVQAAAIKDDMEQLGLLEWITTAPSRAFAQSVAHMRVSELRTKALMVGTLSFEEEYELKIQKEAALAGGALGVGDSWFRGAVTGGSELLANLLFGGASAAKFAALGAGVGGVVAGGAGLITTGPGAVPAAAAGAKFGAGVGAAVGGLRFGFELEAGLAFDEFLEFEDENGQPLDLDVARGAAFAAGSINAGVELLQLEKIARSFPGMKKLKGKITRDVIKQALRNPSTRAALGQAMREYAGVLTFESATEAAQRATTVLAGEMGKVVSGQSIERLPASSILDEVSQEFAGALQAFTFVGIPGPLMGFTRNVRRAKQSEVDAAFFDALADGVSQSKTATRMPAAMQAILERAAKDGPVETVYVDADRWSEYWQSKELDARDMATAVTGDSQAFDEALARGGQIAIPTARYAVKLAATPHHAGLAVDLRLDPEGMSQREAQVFTEQLEQMRAEQAATPDAIPPVPAAENIVREQLVAAGVPVETATQYASLYESVFMNLATRAGLDPVRLFQRYGLQVRREGLEADVAPLAASVSPAPPLPAPEAPGGLGTAVPGEAADVGATTPPRAAPAAGEGLAAPAGPASLRDVQGAVQDALGDLAIRPDAGILSGDGAAETSIHKEAGRLDTGRGGQVAGSGGARDVTGGLRVPDLAGEHLDPAEGRRADGVDSAPDPRARGIDQVPAKRREQLGALIADARANGYTGTDDSLIGLYLDLYDQAADAAQSLIEHEEDNANTWRDLLVAVSQAGGIGMDAETAMQAEVQGMMEMLHGGRPVVAIYKSGPRKGEKYLRRIPRNSAGIDGAPGVFKGPGQGGRTLDNILEALNENPAFEGRYQSLSDLIVALEDATRIAAGLAEAPGASAASIDSVLTGLFGVHPGGDWWMPAPTLEILDASDATLNASGESAASLEAIRRQEAMRVRGEQFVVYNGRGERRIIIGPDAVDYQALEGETFGIESPAGFQKLDDRGGRLPAAPRPDISGDVAQFDQTLFDLDGEDLAPTPAARVAQLEAMATDEAMGTTFPDDQPSVFPDGEEAVVCTNCARRIIRMNDGRGEIYGWEEDSNPTAVVANMSHERAGHDFAVLDDRYLVDPWAKLVEMSSERAVFDLNNPADVAEVLRLYGDPGVWVRSQDPLSDSDLKFAPGVPFQLRDAVPASTVEEIPGVPSASGHVFTFIRNTAKAPDMGERFGQHLEPHGRYMQEHGGSTVELPATWQTGRLQFRKPLVIDWGAGYGEPSNWKQVLSDRYDGKVGAELSMAIIADGFDGVVTMMTHHGQTYASEIVDLTTFVPPTTADVLTTGELQPRLPGDVGAVREQEVAQPKVADLVDDFRLTPPAETEETQTTLFQPLFHGSPYEFEQFSLHAIGTGEGAQAYGWGLYFASSEAVARGYRERLAGRKTEKHLSFNGVDVFGTMGVYEHLKRRSNDTNLPLKDRLELEKLREGLLTLHQRMYWAPPGVAGIIRIKTDLENIVANVTEAKAQGRVVYDDAFRDDLALSNAVNGLKALEIYAGPDFDKGLAVTPASTPGRLFKVEVPDDAQYLEWDTVASQQSPQVQEALKALGFTWQPFKLKSLKQMLNWFAGPTAERLWREDIGIRESIQRGLRAARAGDVDTLNAWQHAHQGYFNQGNVDIRGEQIYRELSARLNREGERTPGWGDITRTNGEKEASRALNALGIAGIKYLDGQSRRAGEGTHNYVLFDEKLITVVEYDQSAPLDRDALEKELEAQKPEPGLIIQHNLTAANVRHAMRMGGLPAPSMAITKAHRAITGFGEITLLGPREMADPRGYARTRVFGADVYSPRYPKISYKIPRAGELRLSSLLDKYSTQTGVRYFDLDQLQQDGRHYLRNEVRVQMAFLESRGVELVLPEPDTSRDNYDFRRKVERIVSNAALERGDDFVVFVDDLFESLNPEERIFQGFTNMGNRRYKPHTLANVLAELKKELRGGESSGNLYGVGQLRAKFTPQFRSLSGIKKASDLLVSREAFEEVKKEVEAELFAIAAELGNPNIDTVLAVLEDAPRMGMTRALKEYSLDERATDDTKQRMAEYLTRLRNLPTEYFEAKIVREVDLAEFTAAVVPVGTPADVLELLKSRGVTIETYEKGNDQDRRAVIESLANTLGDRVLFQDKKAQRRGSLRFGADRQFEINLFERADLTTFLHESGHFYLEVFGDIVDEIGKLDAATLTDRQQGLVADYQALLAWMGVESREQIGREQHEQFARGFEAYLGSGEAPSLVLRDAFARFRAWILGVYRSLKALNVTITEEVKGVMDRLVASDAAIFEAEQLGAVEPMFLTAEAAGMTADQFALYAEEIEAASREAREKLDVKMMADVQREREDAWRAMRSDVEGKVTAEVHERPVYQAAAAIRQGTKPDGTPLLEGLEPEPMKLSKDIIVQRYGKDRLKTLPKPFLYTVDGGIDPDIVADMFGFTSGDEMLSAIAAAPSMRQAIEAETESRMLAEHGGLLIDGSLHEQARAALANDARESVVRSELRALGRLRRVVKPFVAAGEEQLRAERRERAYERRWMEAEARLRVAIARGEKQVEIDKLQGEVRNLRQKARGGAASIRAALPADSVLRENARATIAGQKVRTLKPERYWSDSRRSAQLAIEAAARQDLEGAIVLKQQELLSLALFREASQVKEDLAARVKAAKELAKGSARARLGLAGESYLDQVDGILDRYSFATVSQKALDRRAALARWVADREAEGLPVDLDDALLEDVRRTPYQELTVEELIGVTDGLQQIVHLARLKNRLLKNQERRELDALVEELAESIRTHKTARQSEQLDRDRLGKTERTRLINSFFAAHRKIASLAREIDGFEDGGLFWSSIIKPLNDAGNREATMNAHATKTLGTLINEAYPGAAKRELYDRVVVPAVGKSMTKMGRLMIALNWGNEGNRDRIRRSEKWSNEQVQAILDTLTESDWKFVSGVWDLIDSYWPEIEAKQKRVYGIAPEKVEGAVIHTRFGEVQGKYFPIKYDDRMSATAAAHLDLDVGLAAKQAAYVKATTRRGHTKERAAKVSMPLRLDFGVITEHVTQVIHDLSHHEALLDVTRVLQDRRIQAAIFERHGDIVYKQFKDAMKDIAFGQVPAGDGFEQAINHIRIGATVAGLGWNLTTAMLQPLGLTQSMVRVGPRWVGIGLSRWLRGRAGMEGSIAWIYERSEFMRNRARTQQREINEIRNEVGINTGKLAGWVDGALRQVSSDVVTRQSIADSYFWMIQTLQRVADVPTWLGAYEKAMASGVEETMAVAQADQAVLDSQAGGQAKDLARVQRGGPMLKLWTNFYSFFNTTLQLTVEQTKRTKWSNPWDVGRLGVDYMLLYIVPASMGFFIREALRGDDGDDETLLEGLVRENLGYMAGTLLGFREMSGALQGFSGYEGPAGARGFAALSRLAGQVQQGEADAAFWRALNDSAGILFHYPAGQVRRTIDGAAALAEGRTSNPGALVTGGPRE